MPDMESDVITGDRGGFFTHVQFDWDTEMMYPNSVFARALGFTEAHNIEPVEAAVIDVDDLSARIPTNMGIWLYGNYWHQPEASEKPFDGWYLMGIGARFGTSGHVFDSINNSKRSVHIRGSSLSLSVDDGEFLAWRL